MIKNGINFMKNSYFKRNEKEKVSLIKNPLIKMNSFYKFYEVNKLYTNYTLSTKLANEAACCDGYKRPIFTSFMSQCRASDITARKNSSFLFYGLS